jgi:tetratricopeptide (TPR) repeat protein
MKNHNNYKKRQFIAFLVIAFAMILIYLSSYLPFKKASLYISASKEQAKARSIEEFIRPIDEALNFWSPVGQPEEIRFFASNLLGFLANDKGEMPKEIAKEIVNYVSRILNYDALGQKGLNYTQKILLEASLYTQYAIKYNDLESLKKAEELYRKGLEVSPRRPQFLYGLLYVYLQEGNKEGIKEIGEKILEYWPQDKRVKRTLEEINNETQKNNIKK